MHTVKGWAFSETMVRWTWRGAGGSDAMMLLNCQLPTYKKSVGLKPVFLDKISEKLRQHAVLFFFERFISESEKKIHK